MNDHDLDDLVIDIEPSKSHAKTKSPLTLFALVIIILILGIIFNKNFHQENENSELLEENMSDFIAPELQLQNAHSNDLSTLEETTESEMTSPETKTEESFSLKTLIDNKPKTPLEKMQVIEMPIPPRQRTATQEATTEAQKPIQEPVKEALAQTIDESKTKTVEEIKPVKKEAKAIKRTLDKVENKAVKKVPVVASQRIHTNTKPYYIQVGAFKSNPSKRLLSVITSTGFKYLITEPNSTGAKKLLIGPYRDKASVNKALGTVHTRINKGAYVIRK